MKKEKSWLGRFIAGLGIGAGAAIPGVSGAAVALIFRVYESIINAVDGFTKHVKKSLATLLPILLGVGLAVILCIIVFHWAFEHVMFLLICLFAGFLIGSFPRRLAFLEFIDMSSEFSESEFLGCLVEVRPPVGDRAFGIIEKADAHLIGDVAVGKPAGGATADGTIGIAGPIIKC